MFGARARHTHQTPTCTPIILDGLAVKCVMWGSVVSRAHYLHKQTDQTTTLCVQEVEIYLERWEVLGALVDVCVERRKGS